MIGDVDNEGGHRRAVTTGTLKMVECVSHGFGGLMGRGPPPNGAASAPAPGPTPAAGGGATKHSPDPKESGHIRDGVLAVATAVAAASNLSAVLQTVPLFLDGKQIGYSSGYEQTVESVLL